MGSKWMIFMKECKQTECIVEQSLTVCVQQGGFDKVMMSIEMCTIQCLATAYDACRAQPGNEASAANAE